MTLEARAARARLLARLRELARLSPAERQRVLGQLNERQRAFINDFWEAWAHDGQLEPAGDWRLWMIRAGRGFGKTRAGAEWVWADGNLLRGAAGDFKVSTGFRLHTGGDDQDADPLIASAVGIGVAPAHRGCAYAVFDNLQLASFGNRIPSLTFEVIADTEAVTTGAIASALADEVTSEAALPLGGFAASGGSVGAVLQTLATASGGWFVSVGGGIVLRDDPMIDAPVADAGVAANTRTARRTRSVAAIETVPRVVTLTYYDADRDYQTGMQQARRPGAGTLTPLAPTTLPAAATSGAAVGAADMAIGATVLAAFETPALDDSLLAAPRLTIAAAGVGIGWRRAALLVSTDAGASWMAAGSTAAPATIGTLLAVPAPAPSTLFDLVGAIDVELARADLVLEDADDDRLDGGANLAIVGEELIQFGRAAPLGGARWRLSRLLRGRRGTEAAAGVQAAGGRFVLLDDDSLRSIDLPLATLGSEVRVMASGVGDAGGPIEALVLMTGRSVMPPSPAHLAAVVEPDGSAAVGWVRRSRAGWRWIDGVDAPLGEESEVYRVAVTTADGAVREGETGDPTIAVTAPERAIGPVAVAVSQRGTQGLSPEITLNIEGE